MTEGCSHMTEGCSHMTEGCSHMTEVQSHDREVQSHDRGVQSHDREVQSHDREVQSHDRGVPNINGHLFQVEKEAIRKVSRVRGGRSGEGNGGGREEKRGGMGDEKALPPGPGSNKQQEPQCDPSVKVPLLYGDGHHETPKEEHVGVSEVANCCQLGSEHSQGW